MGVRCWEELESRGIQRVYIMALDPGGGRLGINHARMCVSKSEGYGSLFSFK